MNIKRTAIAKWFERVQVVVTYRLYQQACGWIICRFLEMQAWITERRFVCRALSGESNYNISINADLTVSCNCQDRDGSGVIGDLKKNSFEEIWNGGPANTLRCSMAAGKLPLTWCAKCCDRDTAEIVEAWRVAMTTDRKMPSKGIMVENAGSCQLRCTSCDRQSLKQSRTGTIIGKDNWGRVLDVVNLLKPNDIYYFKIGEPFLSNRILQEVESLTATSPETRIICSTNGLSINTDAKVQAALLMDHIIVSLDGTSTAQARKYQKGQDFDVVYKNMKRLVRERNATGSKTRITWKYVVFNWNDKPADVDRLLTLAAEAGVDDVRMTPTTSPPWGWSWRFKNYLHLGELINGELIISQPTLNHEKSYLVPGADDVPGVRGSIPA